MNPYPEYEADKRYFELKLVQAAERFPDRIGLMGMFCNAGMTDHCIVGFIGNARFVSWLEIPELEDAIVRRFWRQGACHAYPIGMSPAALNNRGIPWGQIPKMLGIVPGEAAPEAVVEVCEEVTA